MLQTPNADLELLEYIPPKRALSVTSRLRKPDGSAVLRFGVRVLPSTGSQCKRCLGHVPSTRKRCACCGLPVGAFARYVGGEPRGRMRVRPTRSFKSRG